MEIPRTKYVFNNKSIYAKWCLGLNLSFFEYLELREGGLKDINTIGWTLIFVGDDYVREPVFPNPIPLERSI